MLMSGVAFRMLRAMNGIPSTGHEDDDCIRKCLQLQIVQICGFGGNEYWNRTSDFARSSLGAYSSTALIKGRRTVLLQR